MRALLNGLAVLVLAAAAPLAPRPALAWGDEGHEIVARIAYLHLTPAVRAKVDQILRGDHDPLTRPDIASRSTWADKYRDSDRNSTRQHYQLTREWHFVDVELDSPDLATACFGHPAAAIPASVGRRRRVWSTGSRPLRPDFASFHPARRSGRSRSSSCYTW
jgi:hypothetical protein